MTFKDFVEQKVFSLDSKAVTERLRGLSLILIRTKFVCGQRLVCGQHPVLVPWTGVVLDSLQRRRRVATAITPREHLALSFY